MLQRHVEGNVDEVPLRRRRGSREIEERVHAELREPRLAARAGDSLRRLPPQRRSVLAVAGGAGADDGDEDGGDGGGHD